MSGGAWFIVGMFAGAIIGIIVMALASIAKQSDEQAEENLEDWNFDKRI